MNKMSAAGTAAAELNILRGRSGGVEYSLHLSDCLHWMDLQPANRVQAIVTDPPYGFKEYTSEEKIKLRSKRGGVWRIPPS